MLFAVDSHWKLVGEIAYHAIAITDDQDQWMYMLKNTFVTIMVFVLEGDTHVFGLITIINGRIKEVKTTFERIRCNEHTRANTMM